MYNRYWEDAELQPLEQEQPPQTPEKVPSSPAKKGILSQLLSSLTGEKSGLFSLLGGLKTENFDRGDLLLILVLLYLFWESEDEELLIILGLMLLGSP
jgi:hypothetical protein